MTERNSTGQTITLDQEWFKRFERDQEIQNVQISDLTKNVSSLTSTVQSMLDSQKALFGRQNRPYPWGAVVGGLSLIGICTGLIIAPIKENIEDQRLFDLKLLDLNLVNAREMGALTERTRWLETLETRNYTLHIKEIRED